MEQDRDLYTHSANLITMETYCIGIDLGGTFIKLAAMRIGEDVHDFFAVRQIPTPESNAEDIAGAMADGAGKLMQEHGMDGANVLGVGIGAPGPLNRAAGAIVNPPNLPQLAGFALRDRIAEQLGIPAALENDANAAALGEFYFGAGKEVTSLVMLTLGTGLGGGVIVDGKVVHGANDFGGEIGHMIVQPDGIECGCGQRGCLEQYASAGNIARQAVDAIGEGRDSRLANILSEAGELSAADVNAARKDGDDLAAEIWDDATRYLAIACINLERLLDCDMIVLAGGLTKAGDDLLDPIHRHRERLAWRIVDHKAPLSIAALGNDAGVVGAAGVAFQAFGG